METEKLSAKDNISIVKNKKSGNLANHLLWLLIIATFLLCLNYIIWGSFYFKCIFKSLTGYECPTCGMQRAIVSLFSGDFISGFWHNPYLTLMLPYFASLIITSLFNGALAKRARKILYHTLTITTLVIIMIAWWVIRNLPIWKDFVEMQITSM